MTGPEYPIFTIQLRADVISQLRGVERGRRVVLSPEDRGDGGAYWSAQMALRVAAADVLRQVAEWYDDAKLRGWGGHEYRQLLTSLDGNTGPWDGDEGYRVADQRNGDGDLITMARFATDVLGDGDSVRVLCAIVYLAQDLGVGGIFSPNIFSLVDPYRARFL